jgi:hypothetical protein
MNNITEVKELEEGLRLAELAPDPDFFEDALADDAVLDGQPDKKKVVEAHRPGQGNKFTKVEMSDFIYRDHGSAVVVTCQGTYEGPQWSGTLKFMRVWVKRGFRWQIVAGSTIR